MDSYITWPCQTADHYCRNTWVYNKTNDLKMSDFASFRSNLNLNVLSHPEMSSTPKLMSHLFKFYQLYIYIYNNKLNTCTNKGPVSKTYCPLDYPLRVFIYCLITVILWSCIRMNICGGFNIGSGTAGNFGYLTSTGSYKRKRDNKA